MTTEMSARKDDTNLAIVALGALAVFAFVNRSKEPPPSPIPSGPLTAQGGVRNVVLGARMGQLDKAFGSTITVAVDYQLRLISADTGAAVVKSWPVRFEVRLGHSTTLGWKTSGELGFAESGFRGWTASAVSDNMHRALTTSFVTPADSNQVWDVHAKMFYSKPDSDGNPSSTLLELGSEFKKDGAVRSVSAGLTAQGGVANVVVGQIGIPREDILRYMVSAVPRGSNIRTNYPGASAGFNQASHTPPGGVFNQWLAQEFIPAFRPGYNPGFGQGSGVGHGSHGMPFRQGWDLTNLLRG